MTAIVPMRPEHFGSFAERAIAGYAHENIASFRWDETSAVERARRKLRKLLPQGIDTPGHYLCEILDRPDGKAVGELWFEVTQAPGSRVAYLYDIYIRKGFRREQHARTALQLLESRCRELGASALGLHVFAHNATAQAMYVSLGFSVTGFKMVKRLDGV